MPESDAAAPPPRLGAGRAVTAALASRLFGRLLGILFIVYLARTQDVATFASYSYLLVLASTLAVLADAGVGSIVARDVARGTQDLASGYRAGWSIAVVTALTAAGGVLAVGGVDSGPGSGGAALAWSSVLAFSNLVFGYQADVLRGAGRHVLEAVLQVLGGILHFALGVAVISLGGDLAALMAVLAIKETLVVTVAQCALPAPWRGFVQRGRRWRLLRTGLILSVASTAVAVIVRAGQLIIGNAGDIRAVADYAVAARVLDVVLLLTWSVCIGLAPSMARYAHEDPTAFRASVLRLLAIGGAVALVGSAVLTPLVGPVLDVVFGERYSGAASAARILLLSPCLLIVCFISWQALVASEAERRVAVAAVCGAVVALAGGAVITASPTPAAAAAVTVGALATVTALLAGSAVRRLRGI